MAKSIAGLVRASVSSRLKLERAYLASLRALAKAQIEHDMIARHIEQARRDELVRDREQQIAWREEAKARKEEKVVW